MQYIIVIQSAYDDAGLSERRLAIAEHTSIASLRTQTHKPAIHLQLSYHDKLAERRIELYESTGCTVKPIWRESWKLYREDWQLPEGRKIVGRLDDDDVLPFDFCEKTHHCGENSEGEMALLWPNGHVFWRQCLFNLSHRGNQFVSLLTDQQTDPHQIGHWLYCKEWKTRVVSHEPGWIWVRHGDAATSTLKRYRQQQVSRIDAGRFRINLRAIQRALDASGKPSGDYREHANQKRLRHVLEENAKHAR